jgi:hypothetical protein
MGVKNVFAKIGSGVKKLFGVAAKLDTNHVVSFITNNEGLITKAFNIAKYIALLTPTNKDDQLIKEIEAVLRFETVAAIRAALPGLTTDEGKRNAAKTALLLEIGAGVASRLNLSDSRVNLIIETAVLLLKNALKNTEPQAADLTDLISVIGGQVLLDAVKRGIVLKTINESQLNELAIEFRDRVIRYLKHTQVEYIKVENNQIDTRNNFKNYPLGLLRTLLINSINSSRNSGTKF